MKDNDMAEFKKWFDGAWDAFLDKEWNSMIAAKAWALKAWRHCSQTRAPEAPQRRPLSDAEVDQILKLVKEYGEYRYAHCLGGQLRDATKAIETKKRISALLGKTDG